MRERERERWGDHTEKTGKGGSERERGRERREENVPFCGML